MNSSFYFFANFLFNIYLKRNKSVHVSAVAAERRRGQQILLEREFQMDVSCLVGDGH